MKKDPRVYLDDIRESIAKIEEYTRGVSFEFFMANTGVQDQVIRRLEIIGEAVKHLPNEYTTQHTDIPWRHISGMRDILIHDYASVNIERVWTVVVRDISLLKAHLDAVK